MGESERCSPDAWGTLLSKLLDHKLATLLSQADVSALSSTEATTVLYEQLRPFLALKSSLKSSEPQSDALQPAHKALLSFVARLFMAAHQALLNDIKTEDEVKPALSGHAKGQHSVFVPSRQFLLEWQLVRLKGAREGLILELADLSERDHKVFQQLRLPEAIGAEVESARLRISNIWKELPAVAREPSPPGEVGGYIAA
jgi:hypothetical protein